MQKIPLTKPLLGDEETALVSEVLSSGWLTQGAKVREFEQAVAASTGAKEGIATTSCTTSLFSSLKLLGIGPGDEVIVPSLSFIASANCIVHAGATPVFCEVEEDTYNIDPSHIEPLITSRTKAILPVHQLGIPCDIDAIYALARSHRLAVVEDAACAIGSSYKGRKIGSGGIVCFSFHPRKLISTGEGGMIMTDDPAFAVRARQFRAHGMSADDLKRHAAGTVTIEEYPEVGYNFRMTDIQAALGIVQMQRLPSILHRRTELRRVFDAALGSISWLRLPRIPSESEWNVQSYIVRLLPGAPLDQRTLMQALLDKGIASRRGLMASHLESCYRHAAAALPVTEELTTHTILLPFYPQMTETETDRVLDVVHSFA
ncbi:MAG: DegT/DnrJ/EryC1/StrS family aminotransferase [Candidatus Peribacteraceae bacterium]